VIGSRHCQTWIERRFSWNKKLTAKAESNCEIYKSYTKCWKGQVSFCHQSTPVSWKNLDVALNIARVEKAARKTCGAVNIGTLEANRFELWMKGASVTVEICVLCGWWFSSAFEIVSETLSSCDTDGRELFWAILCLLLCPEMNWNIRVGKQGYVFILRSGVVMFLSWHNLCKQLFWDWEKLNFLNKLFW